MCQAIDMHSGGQIRKGLVILKRKELLRTFRLNIHYSAWLIGCMLDCLQVDLNNEKLVQSSPQLLAVMDNIHL